MAVCVSAHCRVKKAGQSSSSGSRECPVSPTPLRQERQVTARRQDGTPCLDPDPSPDQGHAGGPGGGWLGSGGLDVLARSAAQFLRDRGRRPVEPLQGAGVAGLEDLDHVEVGSGGSNRTASTRGGEPAAAAPGVRTTLHARSGVAVDHLASVVPERGRLVELSLDPSECRLVDRRPGHVLRVADTSDVDTLRREVAPRAACGFRSGAAPAPFRQTLTGGSLRRSART